MLKYTCTIRCATSRTNSDTAHYSEHMSKRTDAKVDQVVVKPDRSDSPTDAALGAGSAEGGLDQRELFVRGPWQRWCASEREIATQYSLASRHKSDRTSTFTNSVLVLVGRYTGKSFFWRRPDARVSSARGAKQDAAWHINRAMDNGHLSCASPSRKDEASPGLLVSIHDYGIGLSSIVLDLCNAGRLALT